MACDYVHVECYLDYFYCNCLFFYFFVFFFFFSSRRRHTRCLSDWSSDVCSSDLGQQRQGIDRLAEGQSEQGDGRHDRRRQRHPYVSCLLRQRHRHDDAIRALSWGCSGDARSEERRVGKECSSRWKAYHTKKKTIR